MNDEVSDQVDDVMASGERNRGRRLIAAAVVVGCLVSAAAVGWGLTQRNHADDLRVELGRRRAAVLVASGFVEALMGYDFEDLDAQQDAVERFATEQFRVDYDDAFSNEVRDQIVAEEARSTVTVEDVWVSVDDSDELSAIVHARSAVESAGGASADLESYLRVRLVWLDDRWQVDDLVSLGSRDLTGPLPTSRADEDGDADG